jgi:hypothetical protein
MRTGVPSSVPFVGAMTIAAPAGFLVKEGSGCSESLPPACHREHVTRRGVPLTFRRPGRSGRRA